MVQEALRMIWSVFYGWHGLLAKLLWVAVWVGLAAVLLRIAYRQAFDNLWPRLRENLGPILTWGGALLVFGVGFALLGKLGTVVQYRVSAGESTTTARGADPDAAPTTQQAPKVTYLTEKKYIRSLTIPPELLRRVRVEGVQALAPYLTDPTSENITRLVDQFRRSGTDVVFTREATLLSENPIRLDRSLVNVNLDFVSPMQGARRSYYNASFSAQYAFTNPVPETVTARFQFPLPEGSGTLSDFQVIVDGVELSAAALTDGSGWSGTLKPGQTVNVQVTYRHQGARGWSYLLGNRREPIRDFSMTVRSNQAVKFQRYSLYPTKTARTLGGTNLAWELKNVITAQDIALSFTSASLRETLDGLYAFVPFALQLAALFGLLWTFWRRLTVTPVQVGLALAGIVIGTFLGGMLMTYLPVYFAGLIGALVSTLLAVLALGRAYWPPVLLATLLPLAFLSLSHAGLLIALAGVAAITALIWARPRTQAPNP